MVAIVKALLIRVHVLRGPVLSDAEVSAFIRKVEGSAK